MYFELENCGTEIFEPNSTVIHVAGLAHGKFKTIEDFKNINTKCSARLAERAVECGVKRFIFLSSIGVHGNSSEGIIDENSPIQPTGAYAKSKANAETILADICQNTNMELIVLRPTLVYGKNAPGNVLKLARMFEKNVPVPIRNLENKRNFCSVEKLTLLIKRLVLDEDNSFHSEKFVVADTHSKSVYSFMLIVAQLHGVKLMSFRLPKELFKFLLKCVGKKELITSLCSDLVVNTTRVDNYLESASITKFEKTL